MKIKDTKIAGKLPKRAELFLLSAMETREEVLDTDLNLEDIVEVDVEKLLDIVYETKRIHTGWCKYLREFTVEAIAKAGILKWRKND